ncbi:hypothetical protein MASR1M45_28720 [Candidatus Kapaibacterium sp.]
MLKVAVTTIESFRNYLNGSIELEDLLKRVRGEFTPSRYMDLGSAFHDILEKAEERFIPKGMYSKQKMVLSSILILYLLAMKKSFKTHHLKLR